MPSVLEVWGSVSDTHRLVVFRNLKERGVRFPARYLSESHGYTTGAWVVVLNRDIDVQLIRIPVLVCEHDLIPCSAARGRYGLDLADAVRRHTRYTLSTEIFLFL